MTRDAQTEAQLLALAGNADRANRPRMMVIVLALLAIATLVLAFAQAFRFMSASTLLTQRLTERATVERYAEQAGSLRTQQVSLGEIFPENPFMGDQIQDVAELITDGVPGPLITVPSPQYPLAVSFGGDPNLKRATVNCKYASLSIEQLTSWMEQSLQIDGLEGMFIGTLTIRPNTPGRWAGTVEYRRYVYQETTR